MKYLTAVLLLFFGVLAARADSLPAVNSTLGAGVAVSSGALIANGGGPLATLRSANFNSTADQALTLPSKVTAYQLSSIVVTNCSANLTTAAGGFYTAASKGGSAVVAAIQLYSGLTGATIILNPTIAAAGLLKLTASPLYLSLTTAQGGAATCDVYLFGNDLT